MLILMEYWLRRCGGVHDGDLTWGGVGMGTTQPILHQNQH
jgi:hypothetical protein